MKTTKSIFVAFVFASAALFAFTLATGSIKGKILPLDGAIKAWALSGTDTLKVDIKDGVFEVMNAKAGTYRVIIEAKPPYKNAVKENVVVMDGQATDVGEIKLQQ